MEETSQSGSCIRSLSLKIPGCLVPFRGTGVDYGSIKRTAQLTGDGTLLVSDLDSPSHPQERLLCVWL